MNFPLIYYIKCDFISLGPYIIIWKMGMYSRHDQIDDRKGPLTSVQIYQCATDRSTYTVIRKTQNMHQQNI